MFHSLPNGMFLYFFLSSSSLCTMGVRWILWELKDWPYWLTDSELFHLLVSAKTATCWIVCKVRGTASVCAYLHACICRMNLSMCEALPKLVQLPLFMYTCLYINAIPCVFNAHHNEWAGKRQLQYSWYACTHACTCAGARTHTHTHILEGRSSGASWPIFHQQGIIVPFLNEWRRLYLLHAVVGWVVDMNWWALRRKVPAHTHKYIYCMTTHTQMCTHRDSTHQSVNCLSFTDKQAILAIGIHNLLQQNMTNVQRLIPLRHSSISAQDEH